MRPFIFRTKSFKSGMHFVFAAYFCVNQVQFGGYS